VDACFDSVFFFEIVAFLSVRVKWEEVLSLCKNKVLLASAVQVHASAVPYVFLNWNDTKKINLAPAQG
jgi:hypothetical protein